MQILQQLPDGRMVAQVFYYSAQEDGEWITLDNGQHVFIKEGESLKDAINRLTPPPTGDKSKPHYADKIKVSAENPNQEKMIRGKLRNLPARHVKLITRINVKPNEYFKSIHPDVKPGYYTAGDYYEEDHGEIKAGTIELNSSHMLNIDREDIVEHEVGHAVNVKLDNDYYLSNKGASWRMFWYHNKEDMPSDYGKTSPKEGFAESYSRYQRGWLLKPSIKKFFNEYVGRSKK